MSKGLCRVALSNQRAERTRHGEIHEFETKRGENRKKARLGDRLVADSGVQRSVERVITSEGNSQESRRSKRDPGRNLSARPHGVLEQRKGSSEG